MNRKEAMLKSAEYYLKNKISVIPVAMDKKPLIQWREYQNKYATIDEVKQWLEDFPDMQLWWVTGKISSIIVVDVEKWWDISWLPDTAIVSTWWDWFHYYYSYVPWMTNKVRIKNLTDIRSDWWYVVLPPSRSTKGDYVWIKKKQPIMFPINLFQEWYKTKYSEEFETWYEWFPKWQRNNEMAKYIWHILAKTHPSIWDEVWLKLIKEANLKNRPPIDDDELLNTFESIKNKEKRSGSDRWYKNAGSKSSIDMWKDEDNKILPIREIAGKEENSESERYPTGINLIDNSTNWWFKAWDLVVISWMSWHWKTTIAQTFAVNLAELWLPILFFSYEVLISHLWKKFKEMWVTSDHPIYSVEKHTTGNVWWIEQKVKEAKVKYWIKVLVIDHLWFLLPKSNVNGISSNYAAYIGSIVRDLKTLAKDEKIIIILPAHLRKTEDPTMNDLKDSSSISQESDYVFIINRERSNQWDDYYQTHNKVMLVKNRATGDSVQWWFTIKWGRFVHDPFFVPEQAPNKTKKYWYG